RLDVGMAIGHSVVKANAKLYKRETADGAWIPVDTYAEDFVTAELTMDYLSCIDASHFSTDFMASLKALLGRSHVLSCIERAVETSNYCLQEKYCSVSYEVRVNTVESDGHWYHRCLTETNHHTWQWQKQRLYRKNIFPSAPVDYSNIQGKSRLGPILIFSGKPDPRYVDIRLFNLAYAGWVPNIRAEYYKEIIARQKLSQMNLPALGMYLGCVVENGLIVGVAIRRYEYSLERALRENVPCSSMRSGDLVATVLLMQRMGLVKGPVHPSSVVLDSSNRMLLVGIECMFPYDWQGGTKPSYGVRYRDRRTSEIASCHPLGPVFTMICSRVQCVNREKPPRSLRPNILTKRFMRWRYHQQLPVTTTRCMRGVCEHSPLKSPILAAGPSNPHILWIPEVDLGMLKPHAAYAGKIK
ncbi:hypothetical protein GGI07_003762, partial [Coemansia sp. Benny D115]